MPLAPSTDLRKKYKILHDGQSDEGSLVIDGAGLAVDVTTWERHGLKKTGTIRRYHILFWPQVTEYTVTPAARRALGGSTINDNHVVLTIKTSEKVFSTELHSTSVPAIESLVGTHVAKARAR